MSLGRVVGVLDSVPSAVQHLKQSIPTLLVRQGRISFFPMKSNDLLNGHRLTCPLAERSKYFFGCPRERKGRQVISFEQEAGGFAELRNCNFDLGQGHDRP